MEERPLILVTNDDGVEAAGLQALLAVVRPLGEVYAVVPDGPRSGMSHAITVARPLHLTRHRDRSSDDFHCYTLSGTPVDCVKLALNKLLPRRPDLVVSGINHGSNASVNLIYSGTVGAAREGALNGIPSLGLSLLDDRPGADFGEAAAVSRLLITHILSHHYHRPLCLNVNIPGPEHGPVRGIRICRQTHGYWTEEFEEVTGDNGRPAYLLRGSYHNLEPQARDTDEWALKHGYAAVVPLTIDQTRYDDLPLLRALNLTLTTPEKKEN